jgi:hypothetical protein
MSRSSRERKSSRVQSQRIEPDRFVHKVYSNLHILSLGAAAVIDTVLLLAVLERRNRRYVLNPCSCSSSAGVSGTPGRLRTPRSTAFTQQWAAGPESTAMVVMTLGLLLMPSAMLHCVWRIRRSGFQVLTPPLARYLWCYVPVLAVVPIAWRIAVHVPGIAFLDRVWPFVSAYGVWISLANIAAVFGFLRLRRDTDQPQARQRPLAVSAGGTVGPRAERAWR